MAWSAAMSMRWRPWFMGGEAAQRPSLRGRKAASAARAGSGSEAAAAASALTLNPRLLNAVALAVGAAIVLLLLTAATLWLMRAPWWNLRSVEVRGDLQRVNAATLKANTLPRLQGNFFTLDLEKARQVYESVPWVRHAVVQRVWPNQLRVTLQEHQPVAVWAAVDGSERLVNSWGEVFEANLGDVDADKLPELSGPDGSSAQVLQMRQGLDRIFSPLGKRVTALSLSDRGSWSLVLSDESEIELGRGSTEEVLARTQRFAATVSQVTGAFRAPLVSADLRHSGGYAVKLKGVTTIESAASAGRP
jgi:cell division protein FtsQ